MSEERNFREYFIVFLIGAVGYSIIEIIWRGFTHWTMGLTGGVCFQLMYKINIKYESCKLWIKCLMGTTIITFIELIVGCIVNLGLGWNVWDYSNRFMHILGQICPLYSILWFFLCMPICSIAAAIESKFKDTIYHRKQIAK